MKISDQSFLKTPFQKHIATLFSGTIIAQAINVLGALILAKLYAPELYGTYSSFLSFVSILTVINSLKLEYIIITDKSLDRSKNITEGLVFIVLFICLLHLGFFWISRDYFEAHGFIFLILVASSITSFFLSNSKILESFATRTAEFKTIATARVFTSIAVISLQLLLFGYASNGLIYGYGIAMFLVFLFYAIRLKKDLKRPDFPLFKTTIKSHKNILRFAFPSGLVNVFAINIMPILLLTYFSPADTGVFALSLKIVSVPLFIITSSVSQVYFQKASNYFNTTKEKLYTLTRSVARTNFFIMLGILILINTIGIYFLELLFDKNWDHLREYIRLLSILVLGQVTFSPISSLIVIINKMKIGLIFNLFLVCINLLAIYIGYQIQDILYTVRILSIGGGLGYILLLLYFLNHLKKNKNAKNSI
ncbi:oligosaccharide flippase family protein [Flavobacteriaceae bacterium F08102]|nr:oligosaccharide flippase family protein [Flavobacteriaceae bacterium F08102]